MRAWPVSHVTATDHPGQPIEAQRWRLPVIRPSMLPDFDQITRPSATLPSASSGKSSGQRPGLALWACARLRVGTALCEVTPQPHTGCGKFEERFGQDARELTAAPAFQEWRLRGLYIRVLEPGEVGPGDPIHVLSRPPTGG